MNDERRLTLLAQVAQEGLLDLLYTPKPDRPAAQPKKLQLVEEFLEQLTNALTPMPLISIDTVPDPVARKAIEAVLACTRVSSERQGVTVGEIADAKKAVADLRAGGRVNDEPVLGLLALLRKAIERRVVVREPISGNAGV